MADMNEPLKPINTSFYDFEKLVTGGFVYVDKTAQIYELAKPTADGLYYLPRPRRFGKSLMISTLKALFQGRRELFKDLAIERTDWDWEKEVYPVLHLDMSVVASKTADELEISLQDLIEGLGATFNAPFNPAKPAKTNFKNLLEALPRVAKQMDEKTAGKYVLLIDEYDAPIAGLLDSDEGRAELPRVRKALHDFYVQAKAHCGDMRFLMVTGVSKFAKTSIFSAFNNPRDLTLDARAADVVGYTHEEMETYFHGHIQAFADANGLAYDAAFAELLRWYDGYQFSPRKFVKVVNPVSLGTALTACEFGNYWEATAGSTLIFDALKAKNAAPIDFAKRFKTMTLDAPDALTAPTVSLLYQGGYLTIDGRVNGETVALRIPNEEVRSSLYRGYLAQLLGNDFELDDFSLTAEETAAELFADETGAKFAELLKAAFAKIPHEWLDRSEKEIKRYFLAYMVFARAEVVSEEQHSLGRPDSVVKTEKAIYIVEFKYGQSAEAALRQCREKRYADAYADDPRRVVYVGVNYDPAARTIGEVKTEAAILQVNKKMAQPDD